MRPPSYYSSIVKSNNSGGHLYSGAGYESSRSPAATPPAASSTQLRSSFSTPSSSSYASRSHLPYAAQSALVAHCFTGASSSSRPYTNSGAGSGPAGRLLGRPSSRAYAASSASLSSSYSSASSLSSRAPSTKRAPYPSPSSSYSGASTSAAGLMRPSYLSPSLLTASPTSRYRPVTASSYYKPIRLRERPRLPQLSRQINSISPTPRLAPADGRRSHHEDAADSLSRLKIDGEPAAAGAEGPQPANEATWSSDVGRNISRNKYLIKFREIERSPQPNARPAAAVEATIELAGCQALEKEARGDERAQGEGGRRSPGRERTPSVAAREPQAPPSQLDGREQLAGADEAPRDKTAGSNGEQSAPADTNKAPTARRAKKNVKLKVRAMGTKTPTNENEATTTTTIIDKPEQSQAAGPVAPEPAREPPPLGPRAASRACRRAEEADVPVPKSVLEDEQKGGGRGWRRDGEQKAPGKVERPLKGDSGAEENRKTDAPPESAASIQPEPKREQSAQRDAQPPQTQAAQTKTKLVVKTKKKPRTADEPNPEGAPAAPRARTKLKSRVGSQKVGEASAGAAPAREAGQRAAASSRSAGRQAPARIRFREYKYDDFNFLSVLGHGGWGFVILAELKEHDACFAVKCIKKITIVEDDDYESIMIERKVLTLGNIHPFICKLFCTFETPGYLFFVMEYCAGGDLMFHVQHEGKFAESRCRFYAAEIICAMRFLHNRHIIYRDLKLDNILLDERGHIRLVDFGMCQCRTYREEMLPSNFCGTPEYISPEIIKGVPYNHSVDWWSFGVLLFEMAVGKMPFRGSDENELLWNVCYEQIHYPMFLSKELTGLLKLLLEREPAMRMGMATCKAGDIYEQPFFRGLDWRAVEELRVEPPFVPEVRSNRDVSNFDSDFTESTCELSPVDESTLAKIDQTQFHQFPFTNPDIFIFDSGRPAGPT